MTYGWGNIEQCQPSLRRRLFISRAWFWMGRDNMPAAGIELRHIRLLRENVGVVVDLLTAGLCWASLSTCLHTYYRHCYLPSIL